MQQLKFSWWCLSLLVLLFILPSLQTVAQGNLMVMPRRAVFEGGKRLHELNLINTGQDTARYAISLTHYRMKDDGAFEEIDSTAPDASFADKYVRFFPRNVVLGPGEAQSVRIQLTQTGKLLPGEYRSHLYFRAVPNESPLGQEPAGADAAGVAVRLVPVFGISIPVIIRVGERNTEVSLSATSLEMADPATPLLNLSLHRKGNMSVYGNITIEHVSPAGAVTKVGSVQGLAVYTPNLVRHVKIALANTAGVNYSRGKLRIEYKEPPEAGATSLAQTQLPLTGNTLQN